MNLRRYWPWLLLLVPIGFGLSRLRLDVEILNLLPPNSSIVQGLQLYQDHFSNARELIIALESSNATATESAARALALALRARSDLVSQAIWQPPWVESPAQSAEFVAYLWLNQAPATFSNLVTRLQGPSLTNTLEASRELLSTSLSPRELALRGYDPLGLMDLPTSASPSEPDSKPVAASDSSDLFESGRQLFTSSDGTFRILFIDAAENLASYRECLAWLNEVKGIVQKARARGEIAREVRIQYTGRPAFVAEIAGGMETDMTASVGGTILVIGAMFFLVHRRWKPLLWLLVLLVIILAGTTALGALFFGTINVVSMGFAAILLGLSVDYGLVLYQEAQADPQASLGALRRTVAPSIVWSALTTASAFALLNLSSLPGLAQLGTLVAIGILLAALLMLGIFLPPLLRKRPNQDRNDPGLKTSPATTRYPHTPRTLLWVWLATAGLLLFTVLTCLKHPPALDRTANALRPKNSPAYEAVERIKIRLDRPREPLWVLVTGNKLGDVGERLSQVDTILRRARSQGIIENYTLPTALWPRSAYQDLNRRTVSVLLKSRSHLTNAVLQSGFTSHSLGLANHLLDAWQRASRSSKAFWPTNTASRWILGRAISHGPDHCLALGLIHPSLETSSSSPALKALRAQLNQTGAILSGWELLGPSLLDTVQGELPRILLPMLILLPLCLGVAFRGFSGVLLSLATVLVSACGLLLLMLLAGWSWNLLNLMALPLLLGAGVDYSIHIQMALRRHHGNINLVQRTTGRALFLCAATTAVGFGSLAFSSNAGLASLGQVCAAGLVCCFVTAVYLLPHWGQSFSNAPWP
jgi:uncharacterized protein